MVQKNLHKNFETIRDDESEKLFLSKKTYKMRSNKRTETFLYKFAILMEHVDNNDNWMASMHLVVAPQSACGEYLDSVREMTGRENVTYQDMLEHGGGSVRLAKTKCGLDTEEAYFMCEVYTKYIKNILTDLFNILAFETNSTTGWEIIRSCLYGENMYV